MDKVSIIVPVYGIEQYISQCIESLIAQTYKNTEIILVDDGSKDRSGEICDEYAEKDDRIRVYHKQNGGLSSARNHGLQHATGEWIMHVDGDDWIEQDLLELLLNKAQETDADIAMADFSWDCPNGIFPGHFYDWEKQGHEGLCNYIATTWTCLWGSIHRKTLYSDYGISSPKDIKYCEDFHLMVRLCFFAKKIVKVSKPLYHYRQRESSIMHNLNKTTEADERWVYSDTIRFFKEQGYYENFKKVMAWRSLKASQEMALDINTFDSLRSYNPDIKDYILDCPFINTKLKIIIWCLTHNCDWLSKSIIMARTLLKR